MRRRAGFTLMEVLLALAIVAILAGVAGLAVMPNLNKGKYRSAQFQVERFKSALEQYLLDNGAPPTRQQGLAALVAAPTLPPVPASFPAGGYLDKLVRGFDRWPGETINERVEAYVLSLGFSAADIGAFRERLLEPPLPRCHEGCK